MEDLKLRYQQLAKAYIRLEYMVNKFQAACPEPAQCSLEEPTVLGYRDALIKRFEFCYDLTWKFLKNYLKEQHAIEVASPRKVFQECFQQGLITQAETSEFIKIIEARNYASHTYDETVADKISLEIPNYYITMKNAVDRVAVELKLKAL